MPSIASWPKARRVMPADPRRAWPSCSAQALALWRGRPDSRTWRPRRRPRSRRPASRSWSPGCARTSWPPSSTGPPRWRAGGDARRLAADQPYRERRWELLMLALYRAGRQAEALDVYAECRRRLSTTLASSPGSGPAPDAAGGAGPGPGCSTLRPIGERRRRARQRRACPARLDPARSAGWPSRRRLPRPGRGPALVTLVGPPGAGKTRLAVASRPAAEPPVWYVVLEQVARGAVGRGRDP